LRVARRQGLEINEFTGIPSPYERPGRPPLIVDTAGNSIGECLDQIWLANASSITR